MLADLLEELKRKKVFRVAWIYLIGAWIVLQINDAVSEPLGIPIFLQTILIAIVVIGFPTSLLVAWLLGVRGKTEIDEIPVATPDSTKIRVAVLPFSDLSDEQTDAHFGHGIAAAILRSLSSNDEIDVISKVSSFSFDSEKLDLKEIVSALSVTHILSGSVHRISDRIRITTEHIQCSDEVIIWPDTYTELLDDLFELQDRLSRRVGSQFSVTIGSRGYVEQKINRHAYEQYLLASSDYNVSNFPSAIDRAEKSIELDADNPQAHALAAEIYISWMRYGFTINRDKMTQTRRHINSARKLNAEYPRLNVSESALALYAERDIVKAVEFSTAFTRFRSLELSWMSILYCYGGKFDEAIALEKRIMEKDPLNLHNLVSLARRLRWTEKYDEAQEIFALAQEMNPINMLVLQDKFEFAISCGEIDETIEIVYPRGSKNGGNWVPRAYKLWFNSRIEWAKGNAESSLDYARDLEKSDDIMPTLKVTTYLNAHDLDNAFRMCEVGMKQYDPGMYSIAYPYNVRTQDDPVWSKFTSDERYAKFVKRLGVDKASVDAAPWPEVDEILV